jgi:very-short-patch-repair endonuclease
MGRLSRRIVEFAAAQRFLIAAPQALELGAGKEYIRYQLTSGRWVRIHPGVYQIDNRPLTWKSQLLAAVLACGPRALVSHRAALMLWGLEGISSAPVELTVPFGSLPIPDGVVVHRTRRDRETATAQGVPVTTVERTLLDCAASLPRIVIAKALDSAIRKGLTSVDSVYDVLIAKGGRGVRGTRTLRWVLRERIHDTATGSAAEFELLYHMQMAFLPRPELQHPLWPDNGRRVPDFFWPERGKAVEVDGLDAHSSADRLEDDLRRQNDLLDLGIELRRFSARDVRRHPAAVITQIRQFLET